MKNIALICVTHDPSGKNLELLRKVKHNLSETYKDLYITVSEKWFGRVRFCYIIAESAMNTGK